MPVELWNALIVFPLINALVLLHDLLRDFGLAIVFLTLALRFALYPLFLTQLRSQRIMQELQPAVAEIRRKYKGDRQKFAEEQMKLYRERGYNPAAGCLPLLLQFPILIGLWSALQQVGCGIGPPPDCPGLIHGDLQKILYPFVDNPVPVDGQFRDIAKVGWLPWVTEGLTRPEPEPWKILAVLAGITQLVASLMTLPARQQATDDPMQRSMQMMVYYLPLITVFFAWSLPAGLALYWVTSTLFQIAQQYLVSGWGKLAVFLPFLRYVPSPADRGKTPEPAKVLEPKVEAKKEQRTYEGAANGEPVEGRRRRRRRGRR
jgi:YidC/Oxa1 family membrane protein insertase